MGIPLFLEEELCFWRPPVCDELPLPPECWEITADLTDQLDLGEFSWLREKLPAAGPCFAYFAGGRAVAVCRSVRITDKACEAGVETLPAFRGRGLGPLVVSAWAQSLGSRGIIPLYSARRDNAPSLRLAEKAGFAPLGKSAGIWEG